MGQKKKTKKLPCKWSARGEPKRFEFSPRWKLCSEESCLPVNGHALRVCLATSTKGHLLIAYVFPDGEVREASTGGLVDIEAWSDDFVCPYWKPIEHDR